MPNKCEVAVLSNGNWVNPYREAARLAGNKTYVDGTTCKRGHTGARTTASGHCIECRNLRARERSRTPEFRQKENAYRAKQYADPEKHKLIKARWRKHQYGITQDQYEKMLEAQGHKCLICETSFSDSDRSTKACVDHCHKTGKVRGILCWLCNTGIGKLKDNAELLMKAARYLEGNKHE